jgi:hypothetical protein
MPRSLSCIALLVAIGAASAVPSAANDRRQARNPAPPAKDCTRLNGRYGYYDNPWCTPAEQRAWDRAEARRLPR